MLQLVIRMVVTRDSCLYFLIREVNRYDYDYDIDMIDGFQTWHMVMKL